MSSCLRKAAHVVLKLRRQVGTFQALIGERPREWIDHRLNRLAFTKDKKAGTQLSLKDPAGHEANETDRIDSSVPWHLE
ncbi:hypothetical protein VTJ04DRAFT_5585 [Mycothermus thermophilus]|uniref:uncharacterized protein n=1 Tax=Humicola insolens TaxID=85995 RepID=UPI0037423863